MTREEQIKEAARFESIPQFGEHEIPEFVKDVLECCFQLGAQWADEHPRWISVEDELPKDDSLVLTITHSGSQRVGFYNDGWWMASVNISRMGSVTHWMPLPVPPSSSEIPNNCDKEGGEL